MADPSPDRDIRPSRARRLLLVVAGLAFAFIVGFGWQWWAARGYRTERDTVRSELEVQRLATTLAAAVIQADRGTYEGARELASRFFTGLQGHVEAAGADASPELRDILSQRDHVITALSRSDPASEDVLTRIFVRYRVATGGDEIAMPVPAAGPSSPGAAGMPPADSAGGG